MIQKVSEIVNEAQKLGSDFFEIDRKSFKASDEKLINDVIDENGGKLIDWSFMGNQVLLKFKTHKIIATPTTITIKPN